MKAFLSLLILPSLIFQTMARAAPPRDYALDAGHHAEKRSIDVMTSDPAMVLEKLMPAVKAFDAQINTTMASISNQSSQSEKAAAAAAISKALEDVIQLLDNATAVIKKGLTGRKVGLRAIEGLVVELVREISCTLRGVLKVLPIKGILKPHVKGLLKSLVDLIKPLGGVVNGLLSTVRGILNSVLGGLGLGGLLGGVLGIL